MFAAPNAHSRLPQRKWFAAPAISLPAGAPRPVAVCLDSDTIQALRPAIRVGIAAARRPGFLSRTNHANSARGIAAARRARCGTSVHRRKVSTGNRSLGSLQPLAVMTQLLLILCALMLAAASPGRTAGLCASVGNVADACLGSVSSLASRLLAVLLSANNSRMVAVAAALARPAPTAAWCSSPAPPRAVPPPGASPPGRSPCAGQRLNRFA